MKTLIIALTAATALTAGAASAQPWRGDGYRGDNMSIDQREDMLQRRIDRGVESGQLTRREAWQARRAFNDIQRIEYRYKSDGYLNGYERADLDRRLDALAAQVRYDRQDGERYGYNSYPQPRY